jgi:hypothetical protein
LQDLTNDLKYKLLSFVILNGVSVNTNGMDYDLKFKTSGY